MVVVNTQKKKDWTPPQEKPREGLKFSCLADVESEEVNFIWYPYIPSAKLTILEGDPGQGKSFMTCSIAADLSAARKLPGQVEALPPQKILMLSAEDGLEDTVRPRIEKMNGNMDNIFVSDDFFILDPQGIRDLEDLMKKVSATIVFMDPIVAYMGQKVDMHRANEVRGLMAALSEAAKRTGSAIVAVRHLRKAAGGGKAIYAGIGSIDFTAAARSVVQVQESKGGTRYLSHAKHNLTPKGKSIAYHIDGDGKFYWDGIFDDREEEEERKVNTKSKSVAIAEQFLFEMLKDGPVEAATLMEHAAAKGISATVMNRAKKGLAHSKKGPDGNWVWFLTARDGIDVPIAVPKGNEEFDHLLAFAKTQLGGYNKGKEDS